MINTKDWLSNLKLRFSYGTAGNNRISLPCMRQLTRLMVAENIMVQVTSKTLTIH